MNPQPITVGWKTPNVLDDGFVAPTAYANPDIICHRNATNAYLQRQQKGVQRLQFPGVPGPYPTKVLL